MKIKITAEKREKRKGFWNLDRDFALKVFEIVMTAKINKKK